MATIPAGTKFIGIGASVPTPENKSSQNNGFQEVYTLEDLQENVLDLTTPPDEGDVLTYTSGAPAWAPAAGGSDYTETIVNISSAQILAMGSTPIELLPVAGANAYYDIDKIVLEFTHVTTPYSGSLLAKIVDSANYRFMFASTGIFNEGSNVVSVLKWNPIEMISFPHIIAYTPMNEKLSLTTSDGLNPTVGDGTLRVKIYHKTITFGA